MNKLVFPLLLAAAALSACATTTPQADITRFHVDQPIAAGKIYVTSPEPVKPSVLEALSYNVAVARELQRLGFTSTGERDEAAYVATVSVSASQRDGLPQRSRFSIGLGGGFGSGNVGMGGSVQVPVGGNKPGAAITTTLGVSIVRKADNATVWEGRATMDSKDGPAADVPKLAAMMFRDFPGPSGQTVSVRY